MGGHDPSPTATPQPLPLWGSLLALALTVALGLASRRWPLPGLLAEHLGDALYTVAACWALACLAPRWASWRLAGAAWAASALVELSQLSTWPPLSAARAHALGRLVLGQGFVWADLVAYALGAACAGGLLAWGRSRQRPKP